MFSRSVSVSETITMVFIAVALILSITAAAGSVDSCVLQKNTAVGQYKLSILNNIFGEILTTESNGNIYIVSICRPIPQIFYDPRKLSGSIKLTPGGHTIDLGHINQSNVIVNENSIVLTYVGGDRDRDEEDTCKGLRWTTYLVFLCDPLATHDILTLIDEDPDQPEICQVWFEVRTSKTCDRQPNIPLYVLENDFFNHRDQNIYEKEFIKSNEIHFRKIEHDIEKIDNNNKASNIANEVKPRINDSNNKFNKSVSNDNYNIGKENNTINEGIENENSTQIVPKDQWYQNIRQSDSEKKDKYFNEYKKSLNDRNSTYENNPSKEDNRGIHSKKYTPEDKTLAENEKNQPESNKNATHYENTEHNGNKDLENKLKNHKINNTMPGISSNNEYRYPKKNETILHYKYLKHFLNQNKNSEGKYENSVLNESKIYNENQNGPEGAIYNDTKYKKPIHNANKKETISIRNTFEKKPSNKELNNFGTNKKPSAGNENKLNRDYSKNSNFSIGQSTNITTPSSNDEIKYKTVNTSNQSQPKDDKSIVDDNKIPGGVSRQNNTNQAYSQKKYPESESSQNSDEKPAIENSTTANDSTTEGTPRGNSENKPTGGGDKSVDNNDVDTQKHKTIDDNPTIDVNEKNNMINNYSTTSGSDDNTIAVTIKPTANSSSNTVVTDYTTQSGKVNGFSTESPVESSSNIIKTNDKSEANGTTINQTDNVKNNIQPDQSKSGPSGDLSDDNNSDNLKTTPDSSNQSGNGSSFDKLFSKIFPNGVHFSLATIIGALASLVGVTGVAGTVINRYYYKQSGTDQIPFKGTFQSIFNFFKVIITTIFCFSCCGGGGGFDLEASDVMNEKTPLLKPTFSTPTAEVVDETSQKKRYKRNDDGKQQRKDSTDNDDSDKQNSNNEYGSCKSNESLEKYAKEKLNKIENSLQGKSIKEAINGKMKTIFTEKIKPTFDGILEKFGKKVEISEETKKNIESISNDAALISKFLKKEKSTKNIDDARTDVEVKSKKKDLQIKNDEKPILNVEKNKENVVEISTNVDVVNSQKNSENAHSNKIVPDNAVVQEQVKSITVGESQQSPSEEIVSKDVSKTNESKLKFLGLKNEDENVQKVVKDESIVSDKKAEDNEDEVEVIEEIIYIDGKEGDEGEEIIEEITETTTIENSPEKLNEFNFGESQTPTAGPAHTTVTVRTTRKISSSSAPGQVTTIEETVVTDGKPEAERKKSGFQLGVTKSGVNMSVGDKKLEIGKSGLKMKRSKSTSPQNVEGDEPGKRDTKSPEKSKRSMSNLKIFKRSISQPTDDDIVEVEGESQQPVPAASGKNIMSRAGSGLLNFGRSRSKSTLVQDAVDDVTGVTNVISSFADNERKGLLGELEKIEGNVAAAAAEVVRKTSATTLGAKVVSEGVLETAAGSAVQDARSTKNAGVKTKREKKDKTKVTRPF